MATVYLGLGTNSGDRKKHLANAVSLLTERVGTILALSRSYETKAWGFVSENDFLNAALAIETRLSPFELLEITQQIEWEMGRRKKTAGVYCDRIIDIDLLLYEQEVIESAALCLPHPLMHQRRFVLEPLSEIAPSLLHPVLGKSIDELYRSL
jgi:2-amino-4-hydroxy-6-hydroxymethyldihydropteridine diphosphokinase